MRNGCRSPNWWLRVRHGVLRLHQEINRSRYAIRRAAVALYRPAIRESGRSALRLSLAEREEISRGLAAGESLRAIARRRGAPRRPCAGRSRRTEGPARTVPARLTRGGGGRCGGAAAGARALTALAVGGE